MNAPLLLMLISLAGAAMDAHPPKRIRQSGVASWYGQECSKTANGERYDVNSLTAAHPTLPFGTWVEVHNLANGRRVTVRINNRGPFCKRRILDLSKSAAKELQMLQSGTAKVELVVLE